MGRQSSVTRLPAELRRSIDRALTEGRMTLDELHAFVRGKCADAGEAAPSRSALGRYSANFAQAAKVMRENRDMARALAQELGAESVEGEQGRLLVEMLRGLLYRALQHRTGDPDAAFDAAEIDRIARSLKNLSQAMSLEADFARRIREEARREEQERLREAARAVADAPDTPGLSPESLTERILRVYNGEA